MKIDLFIKITAQNVRSKNLDIALKPAQREKYLQMLKMKTSGMMDLVKIDVPEKVKVEEDQDEVGAKILRFLDQKCLVEEDGSRLTTERENF